MDERLSNYLTTSNVYWNKNSNRLRDAKVHHSTRYNNCQTLCPVGTSVRHLRQNQNGRSISISSSHSNSKLKNWKDITNNNIQPIPFS